MHALFYQYLEGSPLTLGRNFGKILLEIVMKKLSNWIMNHSKLIIVIFVLLIALSFVGMSFVQKEGDVINYLDKNTETIIAKNMLEKEFGIIADLSVSISYMQKKDIKNIVNEIMQSDTIVDKKTGEKTKDIISKMVWIDTFGDIDQLKLFVQKEDLNQAKELVNKKFVKVTDAKGNLVADDYAGEKYTTYILAFYLKSAGSEDKTINTLRDIERIVEKNIQSALSNGNLTKPENVTKVSQCYAMGGTANNAKKLIESSLGDMPKFFAIVVVMVVLILLLSTKSYIEPLIFLATLGISLLLNMGSNVIAGIPMGRISTITSSCATILQLAISIDFSIFLMHSYYEELEKCLDPKQALITALPKTVSAISASALTTVGGFIALFFMKYKMGYDLGFVLAKGVILSLLSVIFLQPILIYILHGAVKKTSHDWCVELRLKPVSKMISKKWVTALIVILCLGMAIPCAYFQTQVPLNYITMTKENLNPNLAEVVNQKYANMLIVMLPIKNFDRDELDQHYEFISKINKIGYKLDENGEFLLDEKGQKIKDSTHHELIEVFSLATLVNRRMFDTIEMTTGVTSDGSLSLLKEKVYSSLHASFVSNLFVTDKKGNFVLDDTGRKIINNDPNKPKYMLYTINMAGVSEDKESYATLGAIKQIATEIFGKDSIKVTGLAQGAHELSLVTPQDFTLVSVLSVVIILIILLITFRKVVLSILLLLVIESGIFINLSFVAFMKTPINFMAYLIVTAIELGATVDYAILLTTKYLEEKSGGVESVTAVKNAIYRSAPSILTSSAILISACLSVRLVTSNMIVGQITELIARGALMSVILVFTFLPSLLIIRARAMRAIGIKRGKGDCEEGLSNVALCDIPKSAKGGKKSNHVRKNTKNLKQNNAQTYCENNTSNEQNLAENTAQNTCENASENDAQSQIIFSEVQEIEIKPCIKDEE